MPEMPRRIRRRLVLNVREADIDVRMNEGQLELDIPVEAMSDDLIREIVNCLGENSPFLEHVYNAVDTARMYQVFMACEKKTP